MDKVPTQTFRKRRSHGDRIRRKRSQHDETSAPPAMPEGFQHHHGHTHDHDYYPSGKDSGVEELEVAKAAAFSVRGLIVSFWPVAVIIIALAFWGLLKLNEKDSRIPRSQTQSPSR